MKQEKVAGIVLAVANIILIVVCAVLYFRIDRTTPEIQFAATDTVYREGADNAGLFAGITAYDSDDGDVSDRIVIEKTIEDRENNSIVIFYAVSDRSGNVAKASRVFPAVYAKTESSGSEEAMEQFLNAGIDADLNTGDVPDKEGEGRGTEEPESSLEPEQAETPEPSETPKPTETPKPSEAPTPAKTSAPEKTPEPAPASPHKPAADPSAPVLTLKVSEVKVNAGHGPAWVDVIATLKDDKDNYETLFKNLSVSKYDQNKAGTYQVTVSTEDSDGNRSQAVPLTIVVK